MQNVSGISINKFFDTNYLYLFIGVVTLALLIKYVFTHRVEIKIDSELFSLIESGDLENFKNYVNEKYKNVKCVHFC